MQKIEQVSDPMETRTITKAAEIFGTNRTAIQLAHYLAER